AEDGCGPLRTVAPNLDEEPRLRRVIGFERLPFSLGHGREDLREGGEGRIDGGAVADQVPARGREAGDGGAEKLRGTHGVVRLGKTGQILRSQEADGDAGGAETLLTELVENPASSIFTLDHAQGHSHRHGLPGTAQPGPLDGETA